jgi:hypothetical protein
MLEVIEAVEDSASSPNDESASSLLTSYESKLAYNTHKSRQSSLIPALVQPNVQHHEVPRLPTARGQTVTSATQAIQARPVTLVLVWGTMLSHS